MNEPHLTREDQLAAELRLRPEPSPVTRLSRKVMATLGAVAATAILGALVFALQSRGPRQESTELHSTDHKTTADELEKLPKDYSGLQQALPPRPIPQLGPPLPGDLGRPILNAVSAAPSADEQRIAQEDEAARVGRLFATANVRQEPAAAAAAPRPNANAPAGPSAADSKPPLDPEALQNMQDRKLAFLNASTDKRTVSPDKLEAPAARYVVRAGSVIPAALITGIRSDLPGEISERLQHLSYRGVASLKTDGGAWKADLGESCPQRALACDERRSSRRTTLLGVVVSEHYSFSRDTVDVRRPISHHAERIGADVGLADVVAEYDEDVRLATGRSWVCSGGARHGLLSLCERIGCNRGYHKGSSTQQNATAVDGCFLLF